MVVMQEQTISTGTADPLGFTVDRDVLAAAVGAVVRLSPRVTPFAIARHVLLQVSDDNTLTLTATNMTAAIRQTITVDRASPGSGTINGTLLADVVRTFPTGPIRVSHETKNTQLKLIGNDSAAMMSTPSFPEYEFPVFFHDDHTAWFTIAAKDLSTAVHRAIVAAAQDSSRPVLNGVELQVKSDLLIISAADGYRSAISDIPLPDPGEAAAAIIPIDVAKAVADLAGKRDGDVTIAHRGNHAGLHFTFPGETELTTSIVDGTFPDIRRIVRDSHPIARMTFGQRAMLDAVKCIELVRPEKDGSPTMDVRVGEDLVMIERRNLSSEKGSVMVSGVTTDGTFETFMVNTDYFKDMLASMGAGQVTMQFTGARNALIFQPADDQTFTHVVMPMLPGGER